MRRFARAAMLLSLGLLFFSAGTHTAYADKKLSADQMFMLEDLNGTSMSLETQLKTHKAVLINFWATWCPPCREEVPDLIRLQNAYKDKGFTVIGVDIQESRNKVSKFVKKHKINYPVLLDSKGQVSSQYEIVGIPTSLLVASDGTVLGQYHSAEKELFEDVEKALR